jgi:hypothetical protein
MGWMFPLPWQLVHVKPCGSVGMAIRRTLCRPCPPSVVCRENNEDTTSCINVCRPISDCNDGRIRRFSTLSSCTGLARKFSFGSFGLHWLDSQDLQYWSGVLSDARRYSGITLWLTKYLSIRDNTFCPIFSSLHSCNAHRDSYHLSIPAGYRWRLDSPLIAGASDL